MALSEEKKARIRLLSKRQMEEELILGRASRFNKEARDYILLLYKQSDEDPISEPSKQESNTPHNGTIKPSEKQFNWRDSIIIYIGASAAGGLLVLAVAWILNHFFHLNLKP